MEASVVSSVASTTVAANAGEDATLEFNEGEGDPNENEKKNGRYPNCDRDRIKKSIEKKWKIIEKNWKRKEIKEIEKKMKKKKLK